MIKISRFLKPFGLSVAAVLVLSFLQSLAELYLPTLMADIVDVGILNNDTRYIVTFGGFMLLVAAASVICAVGAAFLSAKTASGFGRDLRSSIFSRVESFSLHEFDTLGTATLITRTTNDINQVVLVWTMIMRMMVIAPLMAIGGIIMAVLKDSQLSLVIVFAIPILFAALAMIAVKAIPLFRLLQAKLDELNRVLREGLTGIRVTRAFNRTDYERDRFDETNQDYTSIGIKVNRIMATLMPTMMIVMNFTAVAIIWFGGIRIDNGEMQIGDLMAFIQYVTLIMSSLVMLSFMFVMIPRASASATRINEVLDTVPSINDPLEAKSTDGRRGHIEFKNVTFSYPGAEQPAIRDISFSAKPGEITAIIGGTGSGKSTLINLIPRFYDVDSGNILVDGVDVREMRQENLRAKLGFVPQKTLVFSGSIADNIRYGKEDASDEEVHAAVGTAQASEFVSTMKEGLASVIAQGGMDLSGGQKQRLSIARALVRKPEIAIFDDSFSAIDFKTDARLRAALRKETANSTVIIVAQRVSTIMDADQIVVLDDGKVVGIGNHKELLKDCDVYREIVYSQLSEDEVA